MLIGSSVPLVLYFHPLDIPDYTDPPSIRAGKGDFTTVIPAYTDPPIENVVT
jgi:hypothetical protein